VEDVEISNVAIETRRFDWFWWGDGDPIHFNIKRRSEIDGTKREHEPPAGIIRNVSIRDVIAHGTGTSAINGHPDSWLENIRMDNVKIFVSHDPQAAYEDTRAAVTLRYARKFTMKDVDIRWEKPESATWKTGLRVEDARGVLLDGVDVASAPGSAAPVVTMKDVEDITLRNSKAATLQLGGNDVSHVKLIQTETKIVKQ
jgi:hypothetical protein